MRRQSLKRVVGRWVVWSIVLPLVTTIARGGTPVRAEPAPGVGSATKAEPAKRPGEVAAGPASATQEIRGIVVLPADDTVWVNVPRDPKSYFFVDVRFRPANLEPFLLSHKPGSKERVSEYDIWHKDIFVAELVQALWMMGAGKPAMWPEREDFRVFLNALTLYSHRYEEINPYLYDNQRLKRLKSFPIAEQLLHIYELGTQMHKLRETADVDRMEETDTAIWPLDVARIELATNLINQILRNTDHNLDNGRNFSRVRKNGYELWASDQLRASRAAREKSGGALSPDEKNKIFFVNRILIERLMQGGSEMFNVYRPRGLGPNQATQFQKDLFQENPWFDALLLAKSKQG